MRLSALLAALPDRLAAQRLAVHDDPVVRGITYDSRQVAPGDLFVALRGAQADGHDYLAQALELGAVALLVEALPEGLGCERPVARVPDTRRALAPIAVAFYGSPAEELRLIGVTGTNGKTSTVMLLDAMLGAAGIAAGCIGTLGARFAGEHERAVNTTPESLDLQRTLRAMCTKGIDAVSMEVSSHGLALGRVDGCRFRLAAMTNVTQDHLDFHASMEAYVEAKTHLFSRHLAPDGAAVVNVDDAHAEAFLRAAQEAGARLVRVSRHPDVAAEVRVEEASISLTGTRARLRLPAGSLDVSLPLIGEFNLENLAVAVGAAVGLGLAPDAIARGAAACPQVPGRTERVGADLTYAPTVLVDYAHTPDAVDKLLRTVRPLSRGRLITVFGCGGDRDRTKRPLMAEAVARHSDLAVATSDNPRTEDPVAILRDVEAGLGSLRRVEPAALAGHERAYAVVVDRREAIALAVSLARAEDTVVIAGKGHEDYQIIGRERLPFDDREEAARVLSRRSG
jgi:UDP-N-acetylmuramoyl-L-alanyl-D-glutamate--2,6-diaminopimelate ligase